MRGKQGAFFLALMLGVTFFLLALALSAPLNDVVQEARTSSELNCTNTSIEDVKKGTCVLTDVYTPYFAGILFGLAGAVLGALVR